MTGRTFTRGGLPYIRPVGCQRIALKVLGKYGRSNKWLSDKGVPGEFPVSYHGTTNLAAVAIARSGYDPSRVTNDVHRGNSTARGM